MNVRTAFQFAFVTALFASFTSTAAQASTDESTAAGGCPLVKELVSTKVPLLGLWRVSNYREINGYKNYASVGDALLIAATNTPGEVCVEFTLPVEGSQHYFLAIESDGRTIDDTVYTAIGGELRILVRYPPTGSGTFVLYNRPLGSGTVTEGGPDEGGAIGEIEDWD